MSDYRIIHADVLAGLRSLPDNSVHVCVTSPPYYGLRSYGTERWEGGAGDCSHKPDVRPWAERPNPSGSRIGQGGPYNDAQDSGTSAYKDTCGKCGARRIDQQIGLEQTPAEYIARLVEVFAEVRRVLRPDGTAWVNMGDSYAQSTVRHRRDTSDTDWSHSYGFVDNGFSTATGGLKPKDLMMMPARLAIALQDAGWWLRSDIIWCKRAPMPESVTDRPTSAHEHIFLLSKAANYYYDADAVREPHSDPNVKNGVYQGTGGRSLPDYDPHTQGWNGSGIVMRDREYNPSGRNSWNYWLLSPEPFPAAHFATFPTEIPKRAILAGTSERGCCAECGAPWRRMVVASGGTIGKAWHNHEADILRGQRTSPETTDGSYKRESVGWQPTCSHNAPTIPCLVLDPFAGAGTTLLVASRLGRRSIGVELNGEYVEMAHRRIQSDPAAMNMKMDLPEQAV